MNVIPRLVRDTENGKLCMQISMGMESATLELPDYLQANGTEIPEEAIRAFMAEYVPRITAELHKRRRERVAETAKRAKKL